MTSRDLTSVILVTRSNLLREHHLGYSESKHSFSNVSCVLMGTWLSIEYCLWLYSTLCYA